MSVWLSAFSSDTLLASLLPLTLVILSIRLLPSISFNELRDILNPRAKPGPFSLQRAVQSYTRYHVLAGAELSRMRTSYAKLGRAHKRIAYKVGYTNKLNRLEEATRLNAVLTHDIADLARRELASTKGVGECMLDAGDLVRTRESLKHFVRDWSEDGRDERERIFGPILDVFKAVDEEVRSDMKVLIPGSGLGRLAWEISQLGFDTTANEISCFMTLAFRFLLSPNTTTFQGQHTIHPYAHWFSHQRTNDSLFRSISFPDIVPRLSPSFHLAPVDFLSLSPPASRGGYDFIATLFFIDTSTNVLATLEHIHSLLRPGGTWVNLGPLLWLGGAQARVELSLEEVLCAAEEVGFIVDGETRRTVGCEYTRDNGAMTRWIYEAEFWVARKWK